MDFDRLVYQCLEKNKDQVIHNASIDHAKVLFEALLSASSKDEEPVRIVSCNLNDDFYGGLVEAGKQCLEKGVDFEVVVLNPTADLSENSFACMVKGYRSGKVIQVKEALENFAHFIVVGERRYRFETDHEQTKAVANFNDPDVGRVIVDRFNALKTFVTEKNLAV